MSSRIVKNASEPTKTAELELVGYIPHNFRDSFYSHSMVAGGLELMSYVTRLIPRTSLMILFEIRPRIS